MFEQYLKKVTSHQSLTQQESYEAFSEILEKEIPEVSVGAFLGALREKGETAPEILGCVKVLREKGVTLTTKHDLIVDTCGTGGDNSKTFNISTAAAFVAAGAGVKIAKHGNRSVSSQCGSADVLEALGIPCEGNHDIDQATLDEKGIVFLFAPKYHPILKKLAALRKALGFKTIFNIVGPLANPVRAIKIGQVVGVFEERLVPIVAEVLKELGVVSALVVHSKDGLDELSIADETKIAELKEGKITEQTLAPKSVGLAQGHLKEIEGKGPKENAKIILSILEGDEKGAKRDIVVLNAAAACVVGGEASNISEGIQMAQESIDSGKAKQVYLNLKK